MKTRIQKWGNSLAFRIPKAFAVDAKIRHNSKVDVFLDNGKLMVVPIPESKLQLEKLLEQVTPQNLHREINTGYAAGNEIW